jgi:hypothetical protein
MGLHACERDKAALIRGVGLRPDGSHSCQIVISTLSPISEGIPSARNSGSRYPTPMPVLAIWVICSQKWC